VVEQPRVQLLAEAAGLAKIGRQRPRARKRGGFQQVLAVWPAMSTK